MSVKINSSVVGSGPDVVLMHGLFGMGNNLGVLARALKDRYRVHSIDLPNHGRSGWISPADIPAMARIVLDWMDDESLGSVALVGHSLGGKVAMEIALTCPDRVRALVVADIAPVAYPVGHRVEFAALTAVAQANPQSRAGAQEIMTEYLDDEMIIQFLLMSLARQEDGSYGWRFNLPELVAGYDKIRAATQANQPFCEPVLFLKGGDSNYIVEEHKADILKLFPRAVLKIMPGCGHWLHAQQPRLFCSLVGRFLDA